MLSMYLNMEHRVVHSGTGGVQGRPAVVLGHSRQHQGGVLCDLGEVRGQGHGAALAVQGQVRRPALKETEEQKQNSLIYLS